MPARRTIDEDADPMEARLQAWAAWLRTARQGEGFPVTNVLHSSWTPPAQGSTPTLKAAMGPRCQAERSMHGRIGELAMRIAAVLAMIRVGGVAPLQRGEQVQVTLDEVERAVYVCETLLPHAASMIREASMGEVAALVHRIVKTLAKEGKLTEARLWSSHAQHWPEVAGWDGRARASIMAALESAERYGLVDKGRSPGGKATYDLSPAARRAVVREVA